jgi:ATP-dependent protease ClpP protease subunit
MNTMTETSIGNYIAKKIVPINGEIDGAAWETSRKIIDALLLQGAPDISIIISSEGGISRIGLMIYDLLFTYPGRKTGIVLGGAHSAASTILQSCDLRICAEHATILTHNGSCDIDLDVANDSARLKKFLANANIFDQRSESIIVARSGLTLTAVSLLRKKNKKLTSKQALNYKLVDRILVKEDISRAYNIPLSNLPKTP